MRTASYWDMPGLRTRRSKPCRRREGSLRWTAASRLVARRRASVEPRVRPDPAGSPFHRPEPLGTTPPESLRGRTRRVAARPAVLPGTDPRPPPRPRARALVFVRRSRTAAVVGALEGGHRPPV